MLPPSTTRWPRASRRASRPATRTAEGPISTPRRLAPISRGTPITRMRRVGRACVPPRGDPAPGFGISMTLAIQLAPDLDVGLLFDTALHCNETGQGLA